MQITFNPMPTIQPNAVKLIAAQRRIDHITACSDLHRRSERRMYRTVQTACQDMQCVTDAQASACRIFI